MYEIIESSEKLTKFEPRKPKRNYPWEKLKCGQSFAIPKSEIKLETIRPIASKKGKQLGKKFKVVEHDNLYEVGRVE